MRNAYQVPAMGKMLERIAERGDATSRQVAALLEPVVRSTESLSTSPTDAAKVALRQQIDQVRAQCHTAIERHPDRSVHGARHQEFLRDYAEGVLHSAGELAKEW